MAEKSTNIKQSDFTKGYYITVNCQFCMAETTFGGSTKKELVQELKNGGWKYLSSDLYGQEGYWCGCDYKD